MKKHEKSCKAITVSAADNGYILAVSGLTGSTYIACDFAQVVNRLAQELGLLRVGEHVNISSSDETLGGSQ